MVINLYVVLRTKKGERDKVCPLHRVIRDSSVGKWKVLIIIMFHSSSVRPLDTVAVCFSAFVLTVLVISGTSR